MTKNAQKEERKSADKELSQEFYNKTRNTSRQDKYKIKNINYEYKYYVINSTTLPNVYKEKLKKMTNNNGYLWKRIYFYGALPVDDDDKTRQIFELFKDKIVVHERDNEGIWKKSTKYKKSKKNNNKHQTSDKIEYSKNHNFSFKIT